MASKNENEEARSDPFSATDVEFKGERPWIQKDANAPEYRVNERVYADFGKGREGPYVVVRVDTNSTPPTYVLETADGQEVNEGREVGQKLLSKES